MEVKIGAVEGESVDRQTIIDIIKHEEEQIKAEKKETIGEAEKKKKVSFGYCFFLSLKPEVSLGPPYISKMVRFATIVNPLSANFTKWSNTLKQFLGCCRRIVSVFDHFVGLVLKGLTSKFR